MESPDLFRYKESEASQVKYQECAGDYFLVVGALFIVNLFLQEKWLTSITIGKFCSISENKPAKNVWKDGRTRTGWFNMT